MRNEFFGDINDYHKYGLLRTLVGHGDVKLGVCWMRTSDDGRHGWKIDYLNNPDRWKKFDPDLFRALHNWVSVQKARRLELIEQSGLIPSATYYSQEMPRFRSEREGYFAEMSKKFDLEQRDLIFFDPDTGLEIPSRPFGRAPSSRHVYFLELRAAFQSGRSLVVIQFFPFKKRQEFIEDRVYELKAQIRAERVLCLLTANVVYFLVLRADHADLLSSRAELACKRWAGRISTLRLSAFACDCFSSNNEHGCASLPIRLARG